MNKDYIVDEIVDVTTYYEQLLHEFQEKIEREKKKYPITEREQIFIDVIEKTLKLLDSTVRHS